MIQGGYGRVEESAHRHVCPVIGLLVVGKMWGCHGPELCPGGRRRGFNCSGLALA